MSKLWISSSGGLGSAVSALIAYEKGYDFGLIFADTLVEDEDLYRFLEDLGNAVGQKHVHLKDGRTPWDVYIDNRYIGNSRTAHCSQELKTKQVKEWLDTNAYADDTLVLGLGLFEKDRLERAQVNWCPRPVRSLLIEHEVHPPFFMDWLEKYGLRPPRLYGMGFSHNNCGGFCCRAGQGQFANLLRKMPARYRQHEEAMEDAMQKIGPTARPFIRKTTHGETEYLSLRQFRVMIENGDQPDMFDQGGCGCFIDDNPNESPSHAE